MIIMLYKGGKCWLWDRRQWEGAVEVEKNTEDEKNFQAWEKLSRIKANKDYKNYQEWEKLPKMRKAIKGDKNCQG